MYGIFDPWNDEVRVPYVPAQQEFVGMQFVASLTPGKNGGFVTRVPKTVPDYHAHPIKEWDDDGTWHWEYPLKSIPGKMCLITRESDACCGKALLEIVAVKDTYVIAKAVMRQYNLPSTEKLVGYLQDKFANLDNGMLTVMHEGKHGSYIQIKKRSGWRSVYLAADSCGNVVEIEDETFIDDGSQASESVTVNDYIFKHHHGVTLSELLKDVVCFRYQTRQNPVSYKFYSHLLDDAYDWGIVTVREVANVEYAEIFPAGIVGAITQFSLEELQEIVRMVSDINNKANDDIATKIRGRKIPYQMVDGKVYLN